MAIKISEFIHKITLEYVCLLKKSTKMHALVLRIYLHSIVPLLDAAKLHNLPRNLLFLFLPASL